MAEPTKYILFKLNDQTFAVEVQQVISIERLQHITAVPRTSAFIKGVTEIRGETTAIVDLKERLQMPAAESTSDTRILVVIIENVQVGLIVDAATEVKDIEQAYLEAAPQIISGIRDTFLHGVAKIDERLILVLDLEKILDFEETNELKEVLVD
ncbi:chemotaxis protein CheW [Oceanobacillus sp. FSL H7-0719]|uniref:chemotaxis protein CheW n=1 Tax=Oceanobacillus sp. FSL H7-0719 TaxID=2954507 RepID=UPI003249935D